VTTTAIDATAAPLQFTTGERPGRGGGEEPGLRPALWSPPPRSSDRTVLVRIWRFLTEPREGVRHAEFFTPYGRPRAEQPRPWC